MTAVSFQDTHCPTKLRTHYLFSVLLICIKASQTHWLLAVSKSSLALIRMDGGKESSLALPMLLLSLLTSVRCLNCFPLRRTPTDSQVLPSGTYCVLVDKTILFHSLSLLYNLFGYLGSLSPKIERPPAVFTAHLIHAIFLCKGTARVCNGKYQSRTPYFQTDFLESLPHFF